MIETVTSLERSWYYTITAYALGGQRWSVTGKVTCGFMDASRVAVTDAFQKFAEGNVILEKPGEKYEGPHMIVTFSLDDHHQALPLPDVSPF